MIILPIGVFLIIYILIAIFFTYKYRFGLETPQKSIQEVHIHAQDSEIEKERLKVEKKKLKTELKAMKKTGKK